MSNTNTNEMTFKHVSYLWDDAKAAALAGDEVALFIYRSNLLGADLRLTNYGGGNTSVKITDKDPLTGASSEVMWIKGSGGDIGTLTKSGCAALYLERLLNLENVYRGIEFEDEMVELFNHCIFDLASKAPSIDTPLHGFLPFKHIDHLHPDAAIAIAANAAAAAVNMAPPPISARPSSSVAKLGARADTTQPAVKSAKASWITLLRDHLTVRTMSKGAKMAVETA